MKLIMKILLFVFIITIITYVSKVDFLGPKISIEEGKSLDFSIGQDVEDWNQYFELYDTDEGELDDKYMTVYAEPIDMNKPGVQYLYVEARDKAGNKSSRSFEVNISSGYTDFDFENFVNNEPVTADMSRLGELTFSSEPQGIDSTNSNARVSRYLGSQGLEIDLDPADKTPGIQIPITIEKHPKYYLKYEVNVGGENPTTDIYLPTLSNTSRSEPPVQLAVTTDFQLKVIDNINNKSQIIKNSNLNKGVNTIEIEYSIGDKLGNPDYVSILLNNKTVYTIENIDLGFKNVNQVLLSVYSDGQVKQSNKVYIDNFKFSMVENELIG